MDHKRADRTPPLTRFKGVGIQQQPTLLYTMIVARINIMRPMRNRLQRQASIKQRPRIQKQQTICQTSSDETFEECEEGEEGPDDSVFYYKGRYRVTDARSSMEKCLWI